MQHKFAGIIPAIGVVVCAAITPLSLASGQAVSLQEQLAAQYKIVKDTGSDASGYSVVEEGPTVGRAEGRPAGSSLF